MQLIAENNTRFCKTLSRTARAGSTVLSRQECISLPPPPFWLHHPLETTYQDGMDCGANILSYQRSKSSFTVNQARNAAPPKSSGQWCESPFAGPPHNSPIAQRRLLALPHPGCSGIAITHLSVNRAYFYISFSLQAGRSLLCSFQSDSFFYFYYYCYFPLDEDFKSQVLLLPFGVGE